MSDGPDDVEAFYDEYGAELGLTGDFDHLEPVLPDVSDAHVLDAGCGLGTGSRHLAERGATVVGVDVSSELVAEARDRHGDVAEFHRADLGEPLSFLDDDRFALVVCSLALGHVADWDRPFGEFARLLGDGGAVVVHAHHPFVDYLELSVERPPHVVEETAEYAVVERFHRRWGPDGEPMPLYRRPLGELFRPALDAGFVLDAFVEPGTGPHETDRYDPSRPPRHLLARFQLSE